jgi:hypothetical protein
MPLHRRFAIVSRTLQIASGVSVLFTTLAFGHIMVHDTQHMLRSNDASQFFIVGHTILAIALGVLSLAGGFACSPANAAKTPLNLAPELTSQPLAWATMFA